MSLLFSVCDFTTDLLLSQPKFERSELHRRPEFEEAKPNVAHLVQSSNVGPSTASTSYASSSTAGPSGPIVKPEPDASAMLPPPHIPNQHVRIPTPNATSTPIGKGKAPMAPNGLHTPIHTPASGGVHGRPPQPQANVDGMAQRVAERHAARVKAIEEAQEAQRREEEEAARAAAVQTSAADAATGVAPQPVDTIESDDFHFPSDDDAFYANVDMDALDEGVGRPIDYDEGTGSTMEGDSPGGVSVSSVPVSDAAGASAPGRVVQQPPRLPQPAQQRTRALSSGPTNSGTRQQVSHQNQNVPPAHAPLQYTKPGSSGERPRTPSMGGGFSFPTGVRPLRNVTC